MAEGKPKRKVVRTVACRYSGQLVRELQKSKLLSVFTEADEGRILMSLGKLVTAKRSDANTKISRSFCLCNDPLILFTMMAFPKPCSSARIHLLTFRDLFH